MKTILSIAGSDSSGGAGIQADLKTITCLGEYGMTAITALTAQNTTGVTAVDVVSVDVIKAQLDAVFTDIFPNAVKIGMMPTPEVMEVVCDRLIYYNAKNVVVDPVMVATSGSTLMEERTVMTLKGRLIHLSDIITPNLYEAQVLSGLVIHTKDEMVLAAQRIAAFYQGAILIKGGHLTEEASDLLYMNGEVHWFNGVRFDNCNTHGTGCTLSSAIATYLAKGCSVEESVRNAKKYVARLIEANLDLGKGRGPLWHNRYIEPMNL